MSSARYWYFRVLHGGKPQNSEQVLCNYYSHIVSVRSCNRYPKQQGEEITLESSTPVTIYGCLLSQHYTQLAVLKVFTHRTK